MDLRVAWWCVSPSLFVLQMYTSTLNPRLINRGTNFSRFEQFCNVLNTPRPHVLQVRSCWGEDAAISSSLVLVFCCVSQSQCHNKKTTKKNKGSIQGRVFLCTTPVYGCAVHGRLTCTA
ncbi:hypothetical protein FHG87_017508 [Trinorchestia longiramus]|nr:hypothetical protein FHG87_017508 [Trinorchestia longiramus]